MDLIGQLAGTLGIEATQAQALAGTVMQAVQRSAADEDAEKLKEAVPEMDGWTAQAQRAVSNSESGLSGLLGAAAGALGGQQAKDIATIATVLGQFGVDPAKATMVAPMILNFLKERLDAQLLNSLIAAAPILAQAAGGGAKPEAEAEAEDDGEFGVDDAIGALGSLFGKT